MAQQCRYQQARGIDDSPVVVEREEKSLSWEVTFAEDVGDRQVLRKTLLSLSEDVARRLWKRGLHGRTVKLKLRYADFTTLTRQVTLDVPTDLEQVIFDQAIRLCNNARTVMARCAACFRPRPSSSTALDSTSLTTAPAVTAVIMVEGDRVPKRRLPRKRKPPTRLKGWRLFLWMSCQAIAPLTSLWYTITASGYFPASNRLDHLRVK